MKSLLLLVLMHLISISSHAACTFDYDGPISVKWQATKTEKKVPVTGTFKTITQKSTASASLEELLKSSSVEIEATSVTSGDEGRDAKLSRFFFASFANNAKVSGKVKSATKTNGVITLDINGLSKDVTFTYAQAADVLKAEGTFAFSFFGLEKQYESISKVCSVQHEGVMGTDAKVLIEAKIKKVCQ